MARILDTTVSADGDIDLNWEPARKEMPNRGTIHIFGGGGNDFGGGTVAVQVSPDGGTTYFNLLDLQGNAISATTDEMNNFELYANGDTISAKKVKIRLALTGSTNPTIRYIIDNIK